jgi:hypothetical protein
MTQTVVQHSWRDRWIWLFLAVLFVVGVAIATLSWHSTQVENDRITDRYVCSMNSSSADC